MPGRTNTEAIRDLERSVATLTERLDNVMDELAAFKTALQQTHEIVTQLRIETAVSKERHETVRQSVERMKQRETRIGMLVLGSILAFLANVAIVVLQQFL